MSGCSDEEEISFSESDRHRYEGGSDGDDDDSEIRKNEHRSSRRRMGSAFGKVVVRQFTKAKKQVRRIRSRTSLLAKSEEDRELAAIQLLRIEDLELVNVDWTMKGLLDQLLPLERQDGNPFLLFV